jgi:hypothetical protein
MRYDCYVVLVLMGGGTHPPPLPTPSARAVTGAPAKPLLLAVVLVLGLVQVYPMSWGNATVYIQKKTVE